VVIADEAHRSQYDLIDGLARNLRDALPKASFIGFIGTPIEQNGANTRAIFGDWPILSKPRRRSDEPGRERGRILPPFGPGLVGRPLVTGRVGARIR